MMHSAKLALLAAAVIPLGGCSLFGHRQALNDSVQGGAQLAAAQPAGSYFTQLGRRELDSGNVGLALEAFQRALAAGEDTAPALNGLGVGYARLGRYDAAQRFFSEAMTLDPANERYAANLARLMRSPAFAMRKEGDAAAQLAAAAPQPAADAPRQAAAAPEPGKLNRVSAAEVRIVTAPPQAAPTRTALARLETRFKPIVQVDLARTDAEAATTDNSSSLITRPRVVNITGFKPEVRVDLAPTGRAARRTDAKPTGSEAGSKR